MGTVGTRGQPLEAKLIALFIRGRKEMTMKKYVKEIWVKFDSRDNYSGNEEKLFQILDKAPGDCIVKVYDANARECKTLSGHSFDDKQLSLLTDFMGEENVKYQERQIEVQQRKERKVPDIVQLIPCNHDLYAVFNDENEKYKYKVLMYALCSDGQIYPLHFDSWLGISLLSEAVYDVDEYELEGGEVVYSPEGRKPDEQR